MNAAGFKTISSLLWLLGAVLFALAVAAWLDADGRQTVFYIVLVLGAAALVRLNQRKNEPAAPAAPPAGGDLVQELLAGEQRSGEAAREWLDRLLQAQQQEEQK